MRTLTATRYAVPLREGGSLPAIIEATGTDGSAELFVTKFKGAGQGAKALVAEIIVGLIAQQVELPVPEVALIEVDEVFGRTERDPEIQDILKASSGLNVGLQFLDGAFNYNPLSCSEFVTPELAADIVWLDALTTNIDRTIRNPNLMIHDRRLWLIDHGAALYFHHDWPSMDEAKARAPFSMISQHVLLPLAEDLEAADARLSPRLHAGAIRTILDAIPDALLMHAPEGTEAPFATPNENRDAYATYFERRLRGSDRPFVTAAIAIQNELASARDQPLPYRR